MIDDLSRSLRAILDDPALSAAYPELAAAQIAFDRPSESFAPARAPKSWAHRSAWLSPRATGDEDNQVG